MHVARGSATASVLLAFVGMQPDVGFSGGLLFLIFLHPGFPALAGRGVASGEGQGGNVGVGNLASLLTLLRQHAHVGIGQRLAGAAIEDVADDRLAALQRDA